MALSSLKSVGPVINTANQGAEMKRAKREPSRRAFLSAMGVLGVSVRMGHGRALAASRPLLQKAIPKTGERLPVIGMGSWR
jgi:hypothetical protein